MARNFAGFFTLGRNINKQRGENIEIQEGVVSDLLPELSVDIDDDDLIELKKKWERSWNTYFAKIEPKQKENEEYWLGDQHVITSLETEDRPIIDNLIFEATEEFLPVATRQNPEPVLSSTEEPVGIVLADLTKEILVDVADLTALKLQMKSVTRNWALYLLGVIKTTWDGNEDNIGLNVIRTQKLILDPEATIDVKGNYEGEYIGEVKRDTARDLITKFPSAKGIIDSLSKEKKGTKIQYTEWWTNDLLFWTLGKEVLDKVKNPHWNYEEDAKNHFNNRRMPYTFLSIFNLGKAPFDETGLIQQNLANQDMVNKRQRQIDKNVDKQNGGIVVSGDVFTDNQAQQAAETLRKGGAILIPSGSVSDAFQFVQQQGLPADVFGHLNDTRSELRNIFGTSGISTPGLKEEDTVRGKILIRGSDDSRIGGGISEFLEQFADNVYNWMVQMIYVYYSEENFIRVLGREKTIQFQDAFQQYEGKLKVSVKEGSLIPKDDLTMRNEAVNLFSAGALDPITLHERLDDPNPKETAKRLFLWLNNPMQLFEGDDEVAQAAQVAQANEQAKQTGGQVPPINTASPPLVLPDINASI